MSEPSQSAVSPVMARVTEYWEVLAPKVIWLLLAGLISLMAVATIAQIGTPTAKMGAGIILLGTICGAAYVTKKGKEVFLFFFVFSLTYNRQYFVLQDALGHPGTQGPYLIAADLFFVGLLALWIYERVLGKRTAAPQGSPLWPWYLPFAAACVFSLFVAAHLDWAAFELIRVAKVGLVLWYARHNLGPRSWWVCVIALGVALSVQSILGSLEVAFHRSGVLWIFGLGSHDDVLPQALEAESFYGMTRAQATMNHPPNLACYLLLTVPTFAALALSHPDRRWRTLCALTATAGIVGLGCTLSRWPIVLMSVLLLGVLVVLTAQRIVNVRQTIAILALGAVAVTGTGLAASDFIANRITKDWNASVDQRLDGFRAAYHMYLQGNPLFGVGLNNYRAYMLKFQPELEWIDKYEGLALDMNVRFPAAPENSFLLVLAESGAVGVLAFAVYIGGAIYLGMKAIARTSGHYRAAVVGLLLGFVGVMLQQSIDHSYWVDPLLYSTALVIGMMNNAVSVYAHDQVTQ